MEATLSDINDTKSHTVGVTTVIETAYDDGSRDKAHVTREADEIIKTNVTMLPDEDGILKRFVDRYTTMLIHDSIFMEEMPAPQFMHQSLSLLNPVVQGALENDPRVALDFDSNQDSYFANDGALNFTQPTLHDVLREADSSSQQDEND